MQLNSHRVFTRKFYRTKSEDLKVELGFLLLYLKTSVVESGEDSDSRVNVFQFSQQSSVKVRVHVAVDPVRHCNVER